jgi:hypothetical protein
VKQITNDARKQATRASELSMETSNANEQLKASKARENQG